MNNQFDVVVVGAGMGGLTTAVYSARAGRKVLLLEKAAQPGGLFGSFQSGPYTFDHGARAVENSGIMFPMFRQLGLKLEFVKSPVVIGSGDKFVPITSDIELEPYAKFLLSLFPQEEKSIRAICDDIVKISLQMRVLYGIENPLFIDDAYTNMKYLTKTLLPWALKFMTTMPKTQKYFTPVKEHLRKFTQNQSLIDFISQHFFEETPALFAMSYFSLYTDYNYPKGGTGSVVKAMVDLFLKFNGTYQLSSEVTEINLDAKTVTTKNGETFSYRTLVWAGSPPAMHKVIRSTKQALVKNQKRALAITSKGKGADSVMTVFMKVKDPNRTMAKRAGMHTFFTPYLDGLTAHGIDLIKKEDGTFVDEKDKIFQWIKEWYRRNTYEISVPVLRDGSLAPEDESGFIVSVLLDYQLTKMIAQKGWYEELKQLTNAYFVDILDQTWIPGLKAGTYETIHASPLTMEKFASVHEGSLSGWSFANKPMLSEFLFTRVAKSILTPYPNIFQAGQWAFAPAGLPTCALTGKLASDKVVKLTKRKHK